MAPTITSNHRGEVFPTTQTPRCPNKESTGASSPNITIRSFTACLSSQHLEVNNDTAYTYTARLVTLIREIFTEQPNQGIFICEFGQTGEAIDDAFALRRETMHTDGHNTPIDKKDIAFVDTSANLHEYLEQAVKAANVQHVKIISTPPYAYIGCPHAFNVDEPLLFHTGKGRNSRLAARFQVTHTPSRTQFHVVCVQPGHKDAFNKMTNEQIKSCKREALYHCMEKAGANVRWADGENPTWLMCGNFDIKLGPLQFMMNAFRRPGEQAEFQIKVHAAADAKPGDYMLLQGFEKHHEDRAMKWTFDHDVVTLQGHKAKRKMPFNTEIQRPQRESWAIAQPGMTPTSQRPPQLQSTIVTTTTPPNPAPRLVDHPMYIIPIQRWAEVEPDDEDTSPEFPDTWLTTQSQSPIAFGSVDVADSECPATRMHTEHKPSIAFGSVDVADSECPATRMHTEHKPSIAFGSVDFDDTGHKPSTAFGSLDIDNSDCRWSPMDHQPPMDSCDFDCYPQSISSETLTDKLIEQTEDEVGSALADLMLQHLHQTGKPAEIMQELLSIRYHVLWALAGEKVRESTRWIGTASDAKYNKTLQYTRDAWYRWLNKSPLSTTTITEAMKVWREVIFSPGPGATQQMMTADTAQKRQNVYRNAFRAWQQQKYGNAAMAQVFLIYEFDGEPASINNILALWSAYHKDPQYLQQKESHIPAHLRTQPTGKGTNQHNTRRRLKQIRGQARAGKVDKGTMKWYQEGGLEEKLKELTIRNGVGQYFEDGQRKTIARYGFSHFVMKEEARLGEFIRRA